MEHKVIYKIDDEELVYIKTLVEFNNNMDKSNPPKVELTHLTSKRIELKANGKSKLIDYISGIKN